MATAGHKHDEVLRPGRGAAPRRAGREVLRTGETVYRRDMSDHRYPEEVHADRDRPALAHRGAAAARRRGRSGCSRSCGGEPDAFDDDEIELAALLGRLLASGVQNIRAYESERATVEELRRLSALRADFVSLVSHELRSPMAAVIGAARTLQERWRELTPDQRAAFLALIATRPNRLATLIGDVLDTSRIEAGTFSYSFTDVDVADLVRDTVAGFALAQDEVAGRRTARRTRCRASAATASGCSQVLRICSRTRSSTRRPEGKSTSARGPRTAACSSRSRTQGPGIPREQHGLIFEKFGRANVGGGKPGSRPRPLHRALDRGGARRTLKVRSAPGAGRDLHAGAAAEGLTPMGLSLVLRSGRPVGQTPAGSDPYAEAGARRRVTPSSRASVCARSAMRRRSSGGSSSSASPR